MQNQTEIRELLKNAGYYSTTQIDIALMIALSGNRPLLIEGDPGVGKTSIAYALSKGLGLPVIRAQMYDGITTDKLLYEDDYQKQLLTLEAVRPVIEQEFAGLSLADAIKKAAMDLNMKGMEFLIKRPILQAIDGSGKKILLIDEIDKSSEEIEHALLEFLEHFSINIPGYGEVRCPKGQEPIVILTSNGYRELSGATKRRCNYLYIEHKTEAELTAILQGQAGADDTLAAGIAKCLIAAQNDPAIQKKPSVSEAITWAQFLMEHPERTKELVFGSLGVIIKNHKDEAPMTLHLKENGALLWN